ncbi:beta-L-arabinofuranosidase domain-containing protein [Marinomonas sp. TI.3.20]|uniref:glycoside hydrolase family 127 protein n=1 Tax=Marinomonas sp. TI.3.20 TaxID=3121296 RepID=UPI00311FB56F
MKNFAQFSTIKTGEAKLTQGFWASRVENYMDIIHNLESALLNEENAARLLNFGIAAGEIEGEFYMNFWSDGDCYKFLEGCLNQYATTKDAEILELVNKYIPWIEASQEEDGYLGTQTLLTDRERWVDIETHELYNMGHLHTLGCVHFEATGDDRLLKVALRNADYLWNLFSDEPYELANFGFNPSQIMGLIDLYRISKEEKYLELANLFVSMRGRKLEANSDTHSGKDCSQNRVPLREETQAVGHAVTGAYLYAGATDVYSHTGEEALLNASTRIWKDLIKRRIYITGAIGPQYVGISDRGDRVFESFASEYNLPHRVAYNETCANIAGAMWAKRMLQVTNEAEYGDWFETIMFNSGISGSSLDMKSYFYSNPAAHRKCNHIEPTFEQFSHVPNKRFFTFDCWCCPPQLLRTYTGMPKFIYSKNDKGIAINLFAGCDIKTTLANGSAAEVSMVTNYPWSDSVVINIDDAPQEGMELTFRIPAWCSEATLNGQAIAAGMHTKLVTKGETLSIILPMKVELYGANPLLEQSNGMVAVKRGPIVYCLEGTDISDEYTIDDLTMPINAKFTETTIDDLPYQMVGLETTMKVRPSEDTLYYKVKDDLDNEVKVRMIPYFSWANREEQDMSIWFPRT